VLQPRAVIASFANPQERIFASIVGVESMMAFEHWKGFFVATAYDNLFTMKHLS
jgi:hypothetical protein